MYKKMYKKNINYYILYEGFYTEITNRYYFTNYSIHL